jgi:hypothetical protein
MLESKISRIQRDIETMAQYTATPGNDSQTYRAERDTLYILASANFKMVPSAISTPFFSCS